MKRKQFIKGAAAALAAATLGLAPLGASAASDTIRLGYVEWDSCTAATNVAAAVLEDAGYKVKTVSVTGALMFQGLSTGDLDAILCAWLPTTHEDYYAKTQDKLEDLGPNATNADLGLAVPDYVEARSIPELAEHAKAFDGKIIGIDPGAGLMRLTGKVIDHYELPMKLIEGSDATMTAVLADAIRREKPVVVTSWRPHWMWASFDVRYLDDPDQVFGEPDEIRTLVRLGLKEDAPGAYGLLKAFEFSNDDRSAVMVADRENDDGMANAREWVEDNQDRVGLWLKAAK